MYGAITLKFFLHGTRFLRTRVPCNFFFFLSLIGHNSILIKLSFETGARPYIVWKQGHIANFFLKKGVKCQNLLVLVLFFFCLFSFYVYYSTRYHFGKLKSAKFDRMIWIELRLGFIYVCIQLSGFHALFTGPTNTFFNKIFIKIGFHSTIHIFKNHFAIVFLIFSF